MKTQNFIPALCRFVPVRSLVFLLTALILFAYLPLDECHGGMNVKTECGAPFHCPFLFGNNPLQSNPLPYIGQLVPTKLQPCLEEFKPSIFRPPKKASEGDLFLS
jgi:hypothetical protein